ncbi:MAG: DNA-binding protein WhiA [Clostridia bacterium]
MNYSEEAKEEIMKNVLGKDCNSFALLCAVTKCLGAVNIYKNAIALEYEFRTYEFASVVISIIKERYDFPLDLSHNAAFPDAFFLKLDSEKSNVILRDLGLSYLDESGHFVIRDGSAVLQNFGNRIAAQSFAQGLFLCNGSLYMPSDIEERGGYHLEITFFEEDYARAAQELFAKCDLVFEIVDRENSFALYNKRSEEICDILAFVKAMNSVLLLNDIILKREINNNINRQTNIFVANADKVGKSNSKYITAIDYIESAVGLESMEEKLQVVARARKENVSESMSGLAERLGVSKSYIARSLAKILNIAEEIKIG